MSKRKLGVWLVGASGNVATTVAVGLAALQKRLSPSIGLLTETAPVSQLPLVPINGIVLGGHEVTNRTVLQTADELRLNSRIFDQSLLNAVQGLLAQYQKNIRTGTTANTGRAIQNLATRPGAKQKVGTIAILRRLRNDLRSFRQRHKLDNVVVIHVASTEPDFAIGKMHRQWSTLSTALASKRTPLPASSLYALAAIEEGFPFVNFTPCLGADVPALRERAAQLGVPIMGADGKTGETLLKTVLAPMFAHRALRVESWVGHNILGNRDGETLDHGPNRSAKLRNKDGVIRSIVGYNPETLVSIEHVGSLHDWKTAWDHIDFRGFLNTRMNLQFVWQGCDSILAAPLVIDLARLADYHLAHQLSGVMTHLACFFKAPMDVAEHDFSAQVAMLHRYVAEQRKKVRGRS